MESTGMPRQSCSYCNGAGKIGWILKEFCYACDGTGYMEDQRSFSTTLTKGSNFDEPDVIDVHRLVESLPPTKICTIKLQDPGTIFCRELSLDGRLLAISKKRQPYLTLWDISTGRMYMDLQAKQFSLSLVFSPDNRLLAGGSDSYDPEPFVAKIWNVANGAAIRSFPDSTGHTIGSMAFSPDGQLLATGNFLQPRIWRIQDGKLIQTLEEPGRSNSGPKELLQFSSDGKFLKARAYNSQIIWRVQDGKIIKRYYRN